MSNKNLSGAYLSTIYVKNLCRDVVAYVLDYRKKPDEKYIKDRIQKCGWFWARRMETFEETEARIKDEKENNWKHIWSFPSEEFDNTLEIADKLSQLADANPKYGEIFVTSKDYWHISLHLRK